VAEFHGASAAGRFGPDFPIQVVGKGAHEHTEPLAHVRVLGLERFGGEHLANISSSHGAMSERAVCHCACHGRPESKRSLHLAGLIALQAPVTAHNGRSCSSLT
jgi:hypothetical protein